MLNYTLFFCVRCTLKMEKKRKVERDKITYRTQSKTLRGQWEKKHDEHQS